MSQEAVSPSPLRLGAICFSVASLLFGRQLAMWMNPVNRLLNHWQRSDTLALATAIFLTAAMGYALARFAASRGSRVKRVARAAFVVLLVEIVLAQIIGAVDESIWWINWILPVLLLASAAQAFLWAPSATFRFGIALALVMSPLGLIVLSQLIQIPSIDIREQVTAAPRSAAATASGPVLIMLFDDWSIARTTDSSGEIDSRLPHLRSLADSSYFFARAASPATQTLLSIPRLIFQAHGQLSPDPNGLWWIDTGMPAAHSSTVPSIFSRASASGLTARIFGFYLPYRALVGNTAAEVRADPHWPKPATFAGNVIWSVLRNIELQGDPLTRLFGRALFDRQYNRYWRDSNLRIEALLKNRVRLGDTADFIFAHFGVPHSPFIFGADGAFQEDSVETRMEPNPRKYFVHIQYTDRVIGRILDDLRAAGTYERSLIVVTSDHGWNFEPDSALRARRGAGTHVPLIIKWPHQTAGARIEEPACLVGISVILDRGMAGPASPPSAPEMNGLAYESCAAVKARVPSFSAASFQTLSDAH